jgi:hypothetical protein
VIGVLGALSMSAGAQAAKAPADFYGVVPQTTIFGSDVERMGTAKVGVMRIIMNWSAIDQTAADGDNDWTGTDALMLEAAKNGIELQPFIFGTPAWVAQGLDHQNCTSDKCNIYAPKSAEALAAWQKFVGEAVARYGPGGDFWTLNPQVTPDPITDWQAWNEMNSKSFYAPKPSPKLYEKLLKAFSVGVRAQDPSANVLLGGMAQLAGSHKAIPGDEFLEELYGIKGASKLFDGVAIHPYGGTVGKVSGQTELFTDVIKKAHDKKVGLWVTEIGAGSDTGGSSLNKGKKGQATLLTDTYKYFAKVRNKYNVQAVDWFSWQDSQTSICAWCSSSGLVTTTGTAKKSLDAFVKLTGGSAGKR